MTDETKAQPEIKIDKRKALRTLKVIAAKHPDYVAGACRYQDQGKPMCLIGHALDRWGFDLTQVNGKVVAGTYESFVNSTGIRVLVPWLKRRGLSLTSGALVVLELAQEAQDCGNSWSESVRRAEQRAINV